MIFTNKKFIHEDYVDINVINDRSEIYLLNIMIHDE